MMTDMGPPGVDVPGCAYAPPRAGSVHVARSARAATVRARSALVRSLTVAALWLHLDDNGHGARLGVLGDLLDLAELRRLALQRLGGHLVDGLVEFGFHVAQGAL